MFMRYFLDEILKKNTMLSLLAGSDREQDKESTFIQDTFALTMKLREVELLITPTNGLVCHSEKFYRQAFFVVLYYTMYTYERKSNRRVGSICI